MKLSQMNIKNQQLLVWQEVLLGVSFLDLLDWWQERYLQKVLAFIMCQLRSGMMALKKLQENVV